MSGLRCIALLLSIMMGTAACCAGSSAVPPNASGHPQAAAQPSAEARQPEGDGTARSVRSYYNWALSRCIGKAARDERDRFDAFATAAGYLEQGELGMEIYEEMSKLVDEYLAKTYGSVVGSDLNTMKCIDLYRSDELDVLVKRFAASEAP